MTTEKRPDLGERCRLCQRQRWRDVVEIRKFIVSEDSVRLCCVATRNRAFARAQSECFLRSNQDEREIK